jgi:tetratricopeptide (TPR) repeat protein
LVVCLAAVPVLLSTLLSTAVAAQTEKDAFRDALIGFHAKLAGDYGDEGPAAIENLQRMTSSLASWDEAIRTSTRELESRLPSAPTSERVRIRTTLAELYTERGRFADAIRELDAALQADSSRGGLYVLRGLVLEMMGRQNDAVAAFRKAWDVDHDDPVSAYLLASRSADTSGADETTSAQAAALLKVLERRLASVPPNRHIPLFSELSLLQDRAAVTPVFSPARYAEGFTYVAEGRYPEAIVSFRRAIASDPLMIGAPARLETLHEGIAMLRNGDAEKALSSLEAAVASSPRSSEVHRILAGAYADAGDDRKSIEHLEKAVGLAPDDERASLALGRALDHAGRREQAEQVLKTTVATSPESAEAHSALADLYESTNRGRSALRELEIAASFTIIAGKGPLYFRLADLEHRHLEYTQVIEPLMRRARLSPNDARAHTDLGLAYTRIGKTNDALIEFVVASLIGPDDADALTAIGQIHFDAGNYAAAEAVLRRAIVMAPTLLQARYLLGHTLARLARAAESQQQLAEFDRLRAAVYDNDRRLFEVDQLRQDAVRAANDGRSDDAIAAWQTVVERMPDRAEDRLALASALIRAGRPSLAIEQLESAARIHPDADVYRQLADVYATLGRLNESTSARETFRRLLREQRRDR